MTTNPGPLELLILSFGGDGFNGDIARSIRAVEASGGIRIVGLILVRKDPEGNITAFEAEDTDQTSDRESASLGRNVRGILTEDDALTLARLLPVETAALVALIEHTWARDIASAVEQAGGKLLASQRIDHDMIAMLGEELDGLMG